jgi:hypothetical protein
MQMKKWEKLFATATSSWFLDLLDFNEFLLSKVVLWEV